MRVSAILFVLLCAGTQPAQAQEVGPSDPETAEARAAFEAGRAAYENGDLENAAVQLQHSFDIRPYVATAYNLAVVREVKGDALAAARVCAEMLSGSLGVLEGGQRREVEAMLGRLDAQLGRIQVLVTGAAVGWWRVGDGETMPFRSGEAATVRVDPGHHEITVGSERARAREVSVRVERGQVRVLELDLSVAQTGELLVVGPERTSRIEIVGVAEGEGRLRRSLPVGVYDVRLPEYPGSREEVQVTADELTRVDLTAVLGRTDSGSDSSGGAYWALGIAGVAIIAAGAVVLALLLVPNDIEPDPVLGTVMALSLP